MAYLYTNPETANSGMLNLNRKWKRKSWRNKIFQHMKESSHSNVNPVKTAAHGKVTWRNILVLSMRERSLSNQAKIRATKLRIIMWTLGMVRNSILIPGTTLILVNKIMMVNLNTQLGLPHQIIRTYLLTMLGSQRFLCHCMPLNTPQSLRETNQALLSNPYSGAAIPIPLHGVTIRTRFKWSLKCVNKS